MKEKQKDISKLIKLIFEGISPRYIEILEERYGLKDGKVRRLEEMGRKRKITRERVRQIIQKAFQKIREKLEGNLFPEWQTLINQAKDALLLAGGVKKEESLLEELSLRLFEQKKEKFLKEKIRFLLISSGEIFLQPQNQERESFFYLNEKSKEKFEKVLFLFRKKIESMEGIADAKKFHQITSSLAKKFSLKESQICSFLSLDKKIETNLLGEVGLKTNSLIHPRGIRDQLHLILRQTKKPLHFRELYQIIKENNLWPKQINIHTVHNELIRDPRFVLVGRGIYALKDWGFQGGTTRDILLSILKKAKRPLSFEEIKKEFSKQFFAKDSTILLNLQKNPQIKRLPNGRYILKGKVKILEA